MVILAHSLGVCLHSSASAEVENSDGLVEIQQAQYYSPRYSYAVVKVIELYNRVHTRRQILATFAADIKKETSARRHLAEMSVDIL